MCGAGRMFRCFFAFVLLVVCSDLLAGAQATSAASQMSSAVPDYDVDTVRINNTGSGSIHLNISDDVLQGTNVQLPSLLEIAFDIRPDQIVGLPHWAQVEHYDIVAKVVDIDPKQIRDLSDDQQRVMLQHLLELRFRLRKHVETRTLPLLKLRVAKEGIKFAEWQKPAEGEDDKKGSMVGRNGDLTATGVPMESLVRVLSSTTHMPVIDETSLKGIYSFHLRWMNEEEGQASGLHDQTFPTIYAALPEELGLKLESGKGPVKVLVIDNVEQPSEN